MKKTGLLLSFLTLGVAAITASAEPKPRTIDDTLKNTGIRKKVLIQGTVKRSFDFDNVLLTDDTAEIAVGLASVKQNVRDGDKILVYGRFEGRLNYKARYGFINALEWAPVGDPKGDALIAKYGVEPSTAPAESDSASSSAPAPQRSVESRLRELEDLKTKKLITDDEYKEQRKRILGQL